jgi:DNA-binding transcriptional LysR family regulator
VLALAAAGMGLAVVPAFVQTINIPNAAYRPLLNFTAKFDLVLVSRRNESSPAIRRFVEIARTSTGVVHRANKSRRSPARTDGAG